MSSQSVSITRISNGVSGVQQDVVAVEEPLEIRIVSGLLDRRVQKNISVTMRTPGHDEELARGFLFTEGIIASAEEVESISFSNGSPDTNSVVVALKPGVMLDEEKLQRNFYTTSSCGVCGKSSLDAVKVRIENQSRNELTVSAHVIRRLPALLRKHQLVFEQTGGLHASALFDLNGELLIVREDVGRHNALDKVIGAVLIDDKITFADAILLVSGRLSFELVQKAAVAGIPIVTAIGAPSSLAVSLAEETGITLIGFVREDHFNIYTNPSRVV